MYIPEAFQEKRKERLKALIEQFSFGTLVSNHEGRPCANHLPFMYDAEAGLLLAHMARANPQLAQSVRCWTASTASSCRSGNSSPITAHFGQNSLCNLRHSAWADPPLEAAHRRAWQVELRPQLVPSDRCSS